MADPVVTDTTTTDTTTTADAAVAASQAATAAAAASAAGAEPVVADAAKVADATPVTTQTVVPDTYDLKWPDGSTLNPAIVERTAATARALGLSNAAGQQLLDQTVQDLTNAETAAKATAQATFDAQVEAWKPGGAEWVKRNTAWTNDAIADAEIGGTPEKLAVSVEKAQQALAKYGPPELKPLLDETGFGSHPAVIKLLASIGRAMSEGSLVLGATGQPGKPKSDGQLMYPDLYNSDGTPKT